MVTVRKTQLERGPCQIGQPDLQRLAANFLRASPDRAWARWWDQDCAAADAEGWDIFNASEPDARLERDDEVSVFPDE